MCLCVHCSLLRQNHGARFLPSVGPYVREEGDAHPDGKSLNTHGSSRAFHLHPTSAHRCPVSSRRIIDVELMRRQECTLRNSSVASILPLGTHEPEHFLLIILPFPTIHSSLWIVLHGATYYILGSCILHPLPRIRYPLRGLVYVLGMCRNLSQGSVPVHEQSGRKLVFHARQRIRRNLSNATSESTRMFLVQPQWAAFELRRRQSGSLDARKLWGIGKLLSSSWNRPSCKACLRRFSPRNSSVRRPSRLHVASVGGLLLPRGPFACHGHTRGFHRTRMRSDS